MHRKSCLIPILSHMCKFIVEMCMRSYPVSTEKSNSLSLNPHLLQYSEPMRSLVRAFAYRLNWVFKFASTQFTITSLMSWLFLNNHHSYFLSSFHCTLYLRDFLPVVLSPVKDGSPCRELIPDPDPFPEATPFCPPAPFDVAFSFGRSSLKVVNDELSFFNMVQWFFKRK